jgi:hypothetical protein
MELPHAPQSLLDPTLLTALGLVLGTAGKMLFDYISKRLRPHEDPNFQNLRKELLEEAEELRKELREEVTRLRGRITELESEVDHWKYRYFSALQSIGSCEHMTDCKGRCPLLTQEILFPTQKLTIYEPPPNAP